MSNMDKAYLKAMTAATALVALATVVGAPLKFR
jgi:hypothetical protein